MESESESPINVTMFSPWTEQCGIRDYTDHLVHALDKLPELGSTRIVPAPRISNRGSLISALSHFRDDDNLFKECGASMNAGSDIAHIQHQYFAFGGVAPYRSHIRSFLSQLRVPAVMTVHEIADEPAEWPGRIGIRLANRLNFAHPAIRAMIVHTEMDRDRLIRIGCPPGQIHLIRHPVPPADTLPPEESARRELDTDYPKLKGRRVITLFGFLSVKKGHLIALQALSHLPETVAMVFAGGRHPDDHTGYVESLESEIARLNLQDRVVITGYLPQQKIPTSMAATEIALAPFLSSSGSGSLANLMAYGRPVVASDIEPHQEIVREAPDVLVLTPAADARAAASAITGLLDDPSRRGRLGHAALAYAADRSYAVMAREIVDLYRVVLRG